MKDNACEREGEAGRQRRREKREETYPIPPRSPCTAKVRFPKDVRRTQEGRRRWLAGAVQVGSATLAIRLKLDLHR